MPKRPKYITNTHYTINEKGETAFHLACYRGHLKIANILMKELNIDLNLKNCDGQTAFQMACSYGKANIVEMMIDNKDSWNFDLKNKDITGKNGFQLAKENGQIDVVNLIKKKIPSIITL